MWKSFDTCSRHEYIHRRYMYSKKCWSQWLWICVWLWWGTREVSQVTLAINGSEESTPKSSSCLKILNPAIVEDIQENYQTLKLIFDTLKLDELSKECKVMTDLKCLAILLGITSCSSMHPCPYGECFKVDTEGEKTGKKGEWFKGASLSLSLSRRVPRPRAT